MIWCLTLAMKILIQNSKSQIPGTKEEIQKRKYKRPKNKYKTQMKGSNKYRGHTSEKRRCSVMLMKGARLVSGILGFVISRFGTC